jgi:hypothetical protein
MSGERSCEVYLLGRDRRRDPEPMREPRRGGQEPVGGEGAPLIDLGDRPRALGLEHADIATGDIVERGTKCAHARERIGHAFGLL